MLLGGLNLLSANERMRTFQDGIPHLAWTARIDGSKDYVNERWKEYTGRCKEDLLDWNWLDLVHPDDRVRHERDWRKAMETGERYQERLRLRRHDGEYRWHSMRDWPTRDADGLITQWFGTATDVDDQRQLEDRLVAAKEVAESANVAKSTFLATMSHEIRTPMNGLIGMTNLLLDTTLSDDQREFAIDARTSAEYLMIIINGILDFSKLDAGRVQIESATFNLHDLVDDVCALLIEQAYEKKIELTCLIEASVPQLVIGDAAKMRQIILNLLGNGLKFTTNGEVSITVEMVESPADSNLAVTRFFVRDSGIGMDPETRTHLFQAFTQADSSMSRRFGGTGLGLAISKGLIEAMGGSLTVESIIEIGSVFTATVPFGRTDEQTPELPVLDSIAQTKFLCIEKNPRVLRSLELHLERLGARPFCVRDAASAMVAARKAVAIRQPFDVIFIDSLIPTILGTSLASSLSNCMCQKPPKFIILTSSPRNLPTNNGDAHITFFLPKPFRFRQVRHCLESVGSITTGPLIRPPPEVPSTVQASVFQGRRVLVAEDNPINQRLAKHVLTKLGIEVDLVENGVEAVRAFRVAQYDVILMDCMMPVMDGYEATKNIRLCEGGNIPIIALTANAMPSDRQRCFSAGMDHYLAKPFCQSALEDILSVCLAGSHTE